jgi:hypothetical protein
MNSSDLKAVYANASATQQICKQFQENALSHVHVKGLIGSSAAFYLNGVVQNLPLNQLIV